MTESRFSIHIVTKDGMANGHSALAYNVMQNTLKQILGGYGHTRNALDLKWQDNVIEVRIWPFVSMEDDAERMGFAAKDRRRREAGAKRALTPP